MYWVCTYRDWVPCSQAEFNLWLISGERMCEVNGISPGFLSLNTGDTLSQIILCVGEAGLCMLDILLASSLYISVALFLQVVTTKKISKHCQMFPVVKTKLGLGENHCPILRAWLSALLSFQRVCTPPQFLVLSTSASHWDWSCWRTACLWSWERTCWSS